MGWDRSVKQSFLVVYDYGAGGVWAYVVARSREEIERDFPELTVVHEPPSWMTHDEQARIGKEATYDLETDRTFGLLAEILDSRGR